MSGFAMKTAGVFMPLFKARYKGAHGARGGAPEGNGTAITGSAAGQRK
jgi:hypothetical protein